MEITLIPIKQIFYNPENDYRVLSCVPQDFGEQQIELNDWGNFTLSGYNLMGLVFNQPVGLDITLDTTSKYPASYIVNGYSGITFVDEIKVDPKHERMLLEQIMSRDQAKNVNKAYPNFVELVLNNRQDEIDIKKIYNVADYRFNDYCKKIKENFGVFLFFARTKPYNILDFSVVSRFYFNYRNPDIWEEAYKAAPYKMLKTYTDWKFEKIDNVILSALPEYTNSEERAKYCILYYLELNEQDGDTKIDARVLKRAIVDDYPDIEPLIAPIIKTNDDIYFDPETKYCSLKTTYEAEDTIAKNIKARVDNPMSDSMEWAKFKNADGYHMTDEQNKICQIANDYSIGLMIGAAGSGKTSATKALIKMLDSYGKTYLLLAPTGIAAKRLRESTGRSASTIHMALAKNDFEDTYDYIIIDEMSCVGVHLLATVFSVIPLTTKIIFVCDNAQLASISCGNIVEDILNANIIPTTTLTKIFRYGTSGIATIATNTRMGDVEGRGGIDFSDNDYTYIDIDNDKALDQVVEAYNNLLLNGYNRNEILILCPFNKSTLGTYTINNAIQEQFNNNAEGVSIPQNGKAVDTITYTVGDRVINIHNNYHANKADINEENEYVIVGEGKVMNGDIGIVRHIDYLNYDAKVNRWTNYNIYVQFDEDMIVYTPKDINNLLLGYCISIHKSQGTQAKAIISIIGKNHKSLTTRNLLYVAVSRAQEKLIEIGDKDCISKGLEKVETIDRTTWLGDLLTKS